MRRENSSSSLVIFLVDLWREEILHVAKVLNLVTDDQRNVRRDFETHLAGERGRFREEIEVPESKRIKDKITVDSNRSAKVKLTGSLMSTVTASFSSSKFARSVRWILAWPMSPYALKSTPPLTIVSLTLSPMFCRSRQIC